MNDTGCEEDWERGKVPCDCDLRMLGWPLLLRRSLLLLMSEAAAAAEAAAEINELYTRNMFAAKNNTTGTQRCTALTSLHLLL